MKIYWNISAPRTKKTPRITNRAVPAGRRNLIVFRFRTPSPAWWRNGFSSWRQTRPFGPPLLPGAAVSKLGKHRDLKRGRPSVYDLQNDQALRSKRRNQPREKILQHPESIASDFSENRI